MPPRLTVPVGARYGAWTVTGELAPRDYGYLRVRVVSVRCQCGAERVVTLNSLRRADSTRCRRCCDRTLWDDGRRRPGRNSRAPARRRPDYFIAGVGADDDGALFASSNRCASYADAVEYLTDTLGLDALQSARLRRTGYLRLSGRRIAYCEIVASHRREVPNRSKTA